MNSLAVLILIFGVVTMALGHRNDRHHDTRHDYLNLGGHHNWHRAKRTVVYPIGNGGSAAMVPDGMANGGQYGGHWQISLPSNRGKRTVVYPIGNGGSAAMVPDGIRNGQQYGGHWEVHLPNQ